MHVTDVAVFKNGYSQISLSGQINGTSTQLRLQNMPVPILGSFWWQAPQGVSVREVRSETTLQPVPNKGFRTVDFLLANAGAQADIVLSNGCKLTGTICPPQATTSTSSFLPGAQEYAPDMAAMPRNATPSTMDIPPMVQLRTATGIATLKEQSILYAEVLSDTPQYPTTNKAVPSLVFELSAPAEGKTLQVSSLSRGLNWVPSYRIDLGPDGKALFQGKATVMNELADLNHVNLELVMGYPALGKYLQPSPVALLHSLNTFLNLISAGPNTAAAHISANITSNNNNAYYDDENEQTGASDLTQAEDLFFYSIPDFSCAAGQTITREIFKGEVNYSHVYTWNVPNQSDIETWQRNQRYHDSSSAAPNEVWHCVRLNNTLKSPWTTGVVDCYAEGRLVGRTVVNFTPEGATSMVKLNKTMQAPVQFSESVVQQDEETMTLEGKLSLTNRSDQEMQVYITKEVRGTPLSASDDATTTCSPGYGDNPNGQFLWVVTVQPGQTKTVSYRYNYIR